MIWGLIAGGAADDGQFRPGSFDSLGAVEMANGVSGALGVKLPQTLIFDYPSVQSMAAHVHAILQPAAVPSLAQSHGLAMVPLDHSRISAVKVSMLKSLRLIGTSVPRVTCHRSWLTNADCEHVM